MQKKEGFASAKKKLDEGTEALESLGGKPKAVQETVKENKI